MQQTTSWRFHIWQILAVLASLGLASCGAGGGSSSSAPTAQSTTIQLSSLALTFSTQSVDTISSPQTVTLTNTGTDTVSISSISTSGDFSQASNCGTSLAPNTSCTTSVTFTPTADGTRTGSLTIKDNAKGGPHKIGLSGSGSAPIATFSPTSLTFATQQPNTTSAAQAVTLTNTGAVSMSISSIKTSGDFAQTNNCGTSLAVNASCTISVTFTPTASGTRTGSLSVADTAAGSPQQVPLTGTGAGTTAPAVSLSASSLSFGSQQLNTTSATQTVTVTNSGTASLSITSVSVTGDFAQTNNCGTSLAAGANCLVNVSFKPTATGTRTGTLSIADNATGSPQQVSLTGSGVGAPVVSLSSASLTFGSQQLNVISQPQTVTVTNTGNLSLSLTSISASGDFSQTNNCGSSVAAGASCVVNVTFYPTATGTRTGTLAIADNATGSPQSVALSGTGVLAGDLVPSPGSMSFGTVTVGQSSTQTMTVANTGGSTVTVSAVGTTGSGLSVSGVSIPFNIGVGQSVSMKVTFAPTSASTVSGSVYLTNNSPSSNVSVAVSGTGASVQHQVTVQWAAPTTTVLGYYAYRSTVSGGPYTRVSSLDTTTNYVDQAVTAGSTYYYVVTSVDSNNVESSYSNEASATVPTP